MAMGAGKQIAFFVFAAETKRDEMVFSLCTRYEVCPRMEGKTNLIRLRLTAKDETATAGGDCGGTKNTRAPSEKKRGDVIPYRNEP